MHIHLRIFARMQSNFVRSQTFLKAIKELRNGHQKISFNNSLKTCQTCETINCSLFNLHMNQLKAQNVNWMLPQWLWHNWIDITEYSYTTATLQKNIKIFASNLQKELPKPINLVRNQNFQLLLEKILKIYWYNLQYII